MKSAPVQGSDPILGAFKGSELTWSAGRTPLVTTAKSFASSPTVVFEYLFPDGAKGTSLVQLANKSNAEVIVNFPCFTNHSALANTLSWHGSFVGAVQNSESTGPQGGPTVFFNSSDAKLGTVVIGSAMNNFKSTSAGPGTTWDGKTKAWAPGTSGTITSLPAGFSQAFVLHAGTGITATIGSWGQLLCDG